MLPEIIPPVSEPLLITSPLNFIISPSKVLSQKVDSFKNLQPVSNQYFIFSKSEIWSLSLMEHSKG